MSEGTHDAWPQRVESLELETTSRKGSVSPPDVIQALICSLPLWLFTSPHFLP